MLLTGRRENVSKEVRFLKECAAAAGNQEIKGLPKYLGSGISTSSRDRYGWVAQEYVEGNSLDIEIHRQDVISLKDARLSGVCRIL